MRRKLFFLLEKLEISRSERIAVSSLFAILLMLSGFKAFYQPSVAIDHEYYAELEELFLERSKAVERENQQILARYEPVNQAELPAAQTAISEPDTVIERNEKERPSDDRSNKININSATSAELQELPGIGPAYAQRIIDWREENGRFTSMDQLLEIRGIGERRLEVIKPLITL